ncbi:MAG: ubiquinone/menaquinone biosynthesis methyltransferase [Chloroflexi bacterium]|nr:ubiquinone/menaquinone biosynthesis methyltransferase [Chloroflexota bacterium]
MPATQEWLQHWAKLTGERKARYVQRMFASFVDRYDLSNRVISFGQDQRWRAIAVQLAEVAPGGTVLDVATGTGELLFRMATASWPRRALGVDFCAPMLTAAAMKAASFDHQSEIAFSLADGLALPFADETFDAVTMAFANRNVADIELALREFYRVTRPRRRVVLLDFVWPRHRFIEPLFRLYVLGVIPWLGLALTGQREAFDYLGASIRLVQQPEELAAMMRSIGFRDVFFRLLNFGSVAIHVGVK